MRFSPPPFFRSATLFAALWSFFAPASSYAVKVNAGDVGEYSAISSYYNNVYDFTVYYFYFHTPSGYDYSYFEYDLESDVFSNYVGERMVYFNGGSMCTTNYVTINGSIAVSTLETNGQTTEYATDIKVVTGQFSVDRLILNANSSLTVDDRFVSTATYYSGTGVLVYSGASIVVENEALFKSTETTFASNGSVTVNGGSGMTTADLYNSGSMTVSDENTLFECDGDLYVGYYNSYYFYGETSAGSLLVESGANVTTGSATVIATGNKGDVTVSDSGTTWTGSGNLYVGYSASGTLKVEDGAVMTSAKAFLGMCSGGTGEVTVSGGASLGLSDTLTVGECGNGTFIVESAGTASAASVLLGDYSGGVGAILVTGSGSRLTTSGALTLGASGEGVVIIDNGGLLAVGGLAFGTSSSGTIALGSSVTSLLTTDTSLSSATANKIYLGVGGYLAISGDVTSTGTDAIDEYLSGVMVYDANSGTWVSATSATGETLISYNYADGTDVTSSSLTDGTYTDLSSYTIITAIAAVPEPSTWALLGGFGALGMAVVRRRRA